MKKNAKRALVIAIVAVAVIASAVSGTMAIYSKTLDFTGNITLEGSPAETYPAELKHCAYDNSEATIKNTDISLKGRGDAYISVDYFEEGYTLSAAIGENNMSKFGVYLDGQYNPETQTIRGTCLQYDNGGISMRARELDLSNDDPKQQGNESSYTGIATAEQLTAQGFDLEELKGGHKLTISMMPSTNGKWEVKIYLNSVQVQTSRPLLITPVHQTGPLYIGARVWQGSIYVMGLNVMQGDIMGERAISMMAEENGTEALKSSASYRFDAADVQAGAQILYQAAGDFWSKYPYEACGAQANSILKISSFGTQDTTVSCECGKDSPWRAADGNNISVHDVSAAFAAFLGTKLPGATVTVALTNSGTDKSVFDKVESVTYSYGGQTAVYTWEDALGVTAPAATEPAPETPEPTAQPTPEAQPDAMQPPTQAEDLPAPETETQVTPQPVESEMPAE